MLADVHCLFAQLYAQYKIYFNALANQYPNAPRLFSSVEDWSPLDYLTQLDSSTRLIAFAFAFIILLILFRQIARYTKFLASILITCFQLALFALMLLALLFCRDSINDFAKGVAMKLGL